MSDLLSPDQMKKIRNAEIERARYRRIRDWAVKELGGECPHCHRTDHLEIHHKEPKMAHRLPGNVVIKHWRELIPQGKMKLSCSDCHIEHEHDGNTNSLKNGNGIKSVA